MTQEDLAIFAGVFEQNTKKGEDDACWIWQGRARSNGGVMEIYRNHRRYFVAAHRWSYQVHFNVTLTETQPVWQECGNKLCVNPAHLRIGRGHPKPENYLKERFMSHVSIQENGCWFWLLKKTRWGYGVFAYRKDGQSLTFKAHRYAYEMLRGPIPDGMVLDHLCRNPGCVNPDHLEIVTPSENSSRMQRANKKQREFSWMILYRDLYKEIYGEDVSEQEWREDAARRRNHLGLR